jgi:hypothetical protein
VALDAATEKAMVYLLVSARRSSPGHPVLHLRAFGPGCCARRKWEHARNVGNVTEATVPVSEDDYVLGVRSVDANGLRSPAAYPVAVRG